MEIDPAVLTEFAITYGLKLFAALATLVIGLYIVKMIINVMVRITERNDTDS